MTIFCISYDLNKSGQNYNGVIEEIKSLGSWWHYLDSTWLVDTNLPVETIRERIRTKTDNNDFFLIIGVNSNYDGWLPQKAWDWINERL